MDIFATFGGAVTSITTLSTTILSVADKWYNVTEEHKSNVGALQHKLEFFAEQITIHGAPVDRRKMEKLKEAETLLKSEEDNLKRLDDRIQSAQYCGVIWWWSVYAKIAMIALPEQLEKNIEKATNAIEDVIAEINWEKESANVMQELGEKKAVDDSTILDNDGLYVAIEETQKDVIGAIEDSTGRSIILLHGGFGKGKSTLARKMCEYFGKSGSKQNMFQHVILLPCGNGDVTSFTKQRDILKRLSPDSVSESIKENSEDPNSTARIAEALRDFFRNKKILVILDDVPGSKSGKSFLMEMWKAIPGGSQHVKFLVTSQESDLCDSLRESSKEIQMKNPTEAEAMKILASHLGWQDKIIPEAFQDDAEEIVETVDGHPLTLAWVAKSIGDRNNRHAWDDALCQLDDLLKDTHIINAVLGEEYANPPAVAMWRSIESLKTDARFILVLMYACRVEVPEDVLRILYSTVKTSTTFSSALQELRNKDLLNPNSSTLAPKNDSDGRPKLSLRSLVKRCCMALDMGESENSEMKPVRDWKEVGSFTSALLGGDERGEQSNEKRVAITLCSLYFDGKHDDEFVKRLATQGHLTHSNEGNIDLRRTAVERIVSFLVEPYKDEHRDEHINSARQVFLKYICKQKLDDDSICALLNVASSESAPLATLAAIADILEIEEAPLLNQGRPRFLEVLVHLLESSISSLSLQRKGKAVEQRGKQRRKQRDQLRFHECASKAIGCVSWKAAKENVLLKVAETPGILTVLVHSVQHTLAHSGTAKDGDPEYSAWALALLAGGGDSVRSQIVDEEDALPTLVQSLSQESHPKLQYHAAGALVALVASQDWIRAKILEEDQALPLLLKYLSQENNQRLQVYATLALGRLARGPESIKPEILEQDQVFAPALPLLLKSLSQDNNPALQQEAAWALGELVHGHDSIKAKVLEEEQALPLLVKSLSQDNNHQLQGNAAWALSALAEGQDWIKAKVLEEDQALPLLVESLSQDTNHRLQSNAAWTLGALAKGPDSIKSKILEESGTLSGLVKALAQDNNPDLQGHAALALGALAEGPDLIKSKILEEGGTLFGLVKALAQDTNPDLQKRAVWALRTLAQGPDSIKSKILKEGGILSGLVKALAQDNNPDLQEVAARALCALAGGQDWIKAKVLEEDQALPLLVKSLSQDNNHHLQSNAAWALGTLAEGPDSIKLKILEDGGALSGLVKALAQDNNPNLQGHAALALGTLAKNPDSIKSKILEEGGTLSGLVKALVQDSNPDLQECATWALGTLANGPHPIKSKIVEEGGALSGLVEALAQYNNPDLQGRAALVLGTLAKGPDSIKSKILEEGGTLYSLVKALAQDYNPNLQEVAAWALCALAGGQDWIKAKVLEEDQALPLLVEALAQDNNPNLQEVAAWALGSLARGPDSIKSKILEEGGTLSGLVKALAEDNNPNFQDSAAWALCALARGQNFIKAKVLEEDRALSLLVKALSQGNNPDLQRNASAALVWLADGEESIKSKILKEDDVFGGLLKCLSQHDQPALQLNAAWAWWSLTEGDDSNRCRILEEDGVFGGWVKYLSDDDLPLKRYAARALKSFTSTGECSLKVKMMKEEGSMTSLTTFAAEHNVPIFEAALERMAVDEEMELPAPMEPEMDTGCNLLCGLI